MLCDLCGVREATLFEYTLKDNKKREYAFCESCYKASVKAHLNPVEQVELKRARLGKECPKCGCDTSKFEDKFLFGCADCYRNMREFAIKKADEVQGSIRHVGKGVQA